MVPKSSQPMKPDWPRVLRENEMGDRTEPPLGCQQFKKIVDFPVFFLIYGTLAGISRIWEIFDALQLFVDPVVCELFVVS